MTADVVGEVDPSQRVRESLGEAGGRLTVEFCGEWFHLDPDGGLTIGRDGDLCLDENPYLHRHFLRILQERGLWWLCNVGSRLSATVCDTASGVQSWLPPDSRLPVVFPRTAVIFTAGPTTYEFFIHLDDAPYRGAPEAENESGMTTLGAVTWTSSQKVLIVALAEHVLRREGSGLSAIPSSAEAAKRLGWTLTRFNRKLDNVCDKLDMLGVSGLRGGPRQHATNRRSRLVEYAVSSRIVTAADLPLLEQGAGAGDLPAAEPEPSHPFVAVQGARRAHQADS